MFCQTCSTKEQCKKPYKKLYKKPCKPLLMYLKRQFGPAEATDWPDLGALEARKELFPWTAVQSAKRFMPSPEEDTGQAVASSSYRMDLPPRWNKGTPISVDVAMTEPSRGDRLNNEFNNREIDEKVEQDKDFWSKLTDEQKALFRLMEIRLLACYNSEIISSCPYPSKTERRGYNITFTPDDTARESIKQSWKFRAAQRHTPATKHEFQLVKSPYTGEEICRELPKINFPDNCWPLTTFSNKSVIKRLRFQKRYRKSVSKIVDEVGLGENEQTILNPDYVRHAIDETEKTIGEILEIQYSKVLGKGRAGVNEKGIFILKDDSKSKRWLIAEEYFCKRLTQKDIAKNFHVSQPYIAKVVKECKGIMARFGYIHFMGEKEIF